MKKLVYVLLVAGFAGSAWAAQVESEKKEVVIRPEDIAKVTALVEENMIGATSLTSSIKTVNKQHRIVALLKKAGAFIKAHPYITAGTLTALVAATVAGVALVKRNDHNSAAFKGMKDAFVGAHNCATNKSKLLVSAEVLAIIGMIYFLSAQVTVEEKAELISQLAEQLPDTETDATVTSAL